LNSIATDWIENIIQPQLGSRGPNLAARKFSSQTERFIDFKMDGFSGNGTYAKYIGDIMRQTRYLGTD